MVDNGYNKMVGWAEPEYQPLGFIPLQSDTGHMQSAFKGTVSVILNDPPCKNGPIPDLQRSLKSFVLSLN